MNAEKSRYRNERSSIMTGKGQLMDMERGPPPHERRRKLSSSSGGYSPERAIMSISDIIAAFETGDFDLADTAPTDLSSFCRVCTDQVYTIS